MKKTITILLLTVAFLSANAQRYTISGTVRDSASGETMIGATIYDQKSGKGTLTNADGRYSLTLSSDSVKLRVSYVGYRTEYSTFQLKANRTLDVNMVTNTNLRTVKITAEKVNSHRSSQMSAIEVPVEHIKSVPVIFGESDVLKALQLLPGVQAGTEGMSGIYVRGGGPDENLFLLDGVPMYNVNHLGGFFSAFNADAIKGVTLYKGSFPARFGDRLSSVLDITTNDGNDNKLHGNASIGLISAKVNLEGPIVKDKTTFNVSARRTYADALLQPVIRAVSAAEGMKAGIGYFFYDLNAKVTHKFSNKSKLIGSYYMGDDVVYFNATPRSIMSGNSSEKIGMKYNWGNIVGSLKWNYVLNPKLFMNLTGSYTRYRNDVGVTIENIYSTSSTTDMYRYESTYNSGIFDYSLRADFDYQPTPEHMVKFGGHYTYHIFRPDVTTLREEEHVVSVDGSDDYDQDNKTTVGDSNVHANEMSVFIEDDWSITESLKINMGLHASSFIVQGKPYASFQPRLSGRFMITDDLSVKAGYAMMTQYMHLLSNGSINLPTDLWVPVTKRIKPMTSHQIATGVFYNISGLFDVSAEAYYKWMDNLLEYKEGSSFFAGSTGWEDKVCMGRGWAYGIELLLQRTVGEITGWVGYTWSKTMRLFDRPGQTLNDGEPFPAKYDRRHDISIMLSYKPNKDFDVGLTWVYSTGNALTLGLQEFEDPDLGTITYIEKKNNYRMPAYHRMDVGVNFHKQLKRGHRTLSISVYNLYNRKNPFIVYKKSNSGSFYDNKLYGSSLVQLSLFPILPSVSYVYNF